MITALEAIRLAKEIGGKDGLNCIAELDETTVAEQTECSGNVPLPLLFGVPVLVKDNIDVKGFHTTAGSLALRHLRIVVLQSRRLMNRRHLSFPPL